MVVLVIMFPSMVMHYKGVASNIDPNTMRIEVPQIELPAARSRATPAVAIRLQPIGSLDLQLWPGPFAIAPTMIAPVVKLSCDHSSSWLLISGTQ